MDSIKFSFNSIKFLTFKLERVLKELDTYYYYSDDYRFIISTLHNSLIISYNEFLKIIEKSFYDIKKDILYNKFIEDSDNIIIELKILTYIHSVVRFIKLAKDFNVHQGIFILIRECMKKISSDSKFIFIPRFEFDYSYKHLTDTLFKISTDKNLSKMDIVLFAIPYFNQADIFSSALLGHELGHFILRKEEKVKKEKSQLKALKVEDATFSPDFRTRIYSWNTEFACDLLGLKIFGLSYFFAFFEFIFLENPFKAGTKDYPPNWLRLKLLIKEIKKTGIYDIIDDNIELLKIGLRDYGKEIKTFIDFFDNKIDDFKNKSKFERFGREINYIESKNEFKRIIDSMDKILSSSENYKELEYYYDKDSISEVKELIKLLNEYITPNELILKGDKVGKPKIKVASIRNILNAGWLFLLFNIKKHYRIFNVNKEKEFKKREEKKMEIRQKLNELVLKAIESSYIKTKFCES